MESGRGTALCGLEEGDSGVEFLKGLSPETLAVVGVLMILREVFAFVKTRQIDSTAEKVQLHDTQLVKTLTKINENIEAQTDLIRGFVGEMKELRRDMDGLRRDVDSLVIDVKRRPLIT